MIFEELNKIIEKKKNIQPLNLIFSFFRFLCLVLLDCLLVLFFLKVLLEFVFLFLVRVLVLKFVFGLKIIIQIRIRVGWCFKILFFANLKQKFRFLYA